MLRAMICTVARLSEERAMADWRSWRRVGFVGRGSGMGRERLHIAAGSASRHRLVGERVNEVKGTQPKFLGCVDQLYGAMCHLGIQRAKPDIHCSFYRTHQNLSGGLQFWTLHFTSEFHP